MASSSTEDFKIVADEDYEEYHKTAADFKQVEELVEKVFDVMPERVDGNNSNANGEKGVDHLRAEIEMLDSMIARSADGLLDLQVMKEELEAREREMEWKMSESMELKKAMEELKRKKNMELARKGKAENGGRKMKWAVPVEAALTAFAGIVAAVVLVVNVKGDKGKNKSKQD